MAQYYVDAVDGNNGNAGTSPGAAKQTITAGEALLANTDHLWIKGNGNYNETVTLAAGGGTYASCKSWEGYTTTPGDGGLATISGQSTRANGVHMTAARNDRVYRNIRVILTTGACWNMSTSTKITFDNCHAENNAAGSGFQTAGAVVRFNDCTSTNSGFAAFTMSSGHVIRCKAISPGTSGYTFTGTAIMVYCTVLGTGASNTNMIQIPGGTLSAAIINCLVDGKGVANRRAIGFAAATTTGSVMIVNNIFHRLNEGIRQFNDTAAGDGQSYYLIQNNMFSSVTTWFSNGWTHDTRPPTLSSLQFNDAATFVDADNNDYTPLADSPQLKKGVDLEFNYTAGGMDLGPIQRIPEPAGVGGGGALLLPVGMTGGTV